MLDLSQLLKFKLQLLNKSQLQHFVTQNLTWIKKGFVIPHKLFWYLQQASRSTFFLFLFFLRSAFIFCTEV